MKILTVLTYYFPHWTGLTAHAVRVAEGLAERGHEVTVLTAQHDPSLPLEETVNGVRIVRLPTAGRFSRGMVAPGFPRVASRLIAEADVVQIHTPLPEALVVAVLCRVHGTPLLMTHHGDVVMPPGARNQLLQRAAFRVLANAARLADGVTSYSMDYARNSRLLSRFLPKLSTIYPPVEIVAPDEDGMAEWIEELGLKDKSLIGFAGRWVDEKGFDYLLRALPLIRDEIPEAHLVFAGERHIAYEDTYDRCLPLIEAQSEHITFLGLLQDPQQMANFYGMCDVFTLPSRTDMFALTQVESMLCGTPVVASDIPGARVVVQETGFGVLVEPRNPRALADGIIEVLEHPEKYEPTREKVREVFDYDDTLDKYEEALGKAITRRHASKALREGGRPAELDELYGAAFVKGRPGGSSAAGGDAGSAGVAGTDDATDRFCAGADVVRYREGAGLDSSLTWRDHEVLDGVLRNEADMAYRRRARILLDYLELEDGDRVLDCGCGMGFYLMAMSKLRDLELLGLDGDVDRLNWARSEDVDATLVQGDIHRMALADES
ncbi:MAG: glycosyltransferase, partial [Anaerolineae bacterium]